MKILAKIGTRGSPLAMYQAELVKASIEKAYPLATIEIIKIKTSGDMIRHSDPHPLDTKRIYTKEIEEALLNKAVDIAVHSAKDMAVTPYEGLSSGVALRREDPRDCLVALEGKTLADLGPNARIGTSSLRRKTQLLKSVPTLEVAELHGNVGTRISHVDDRKFDGIILAHAGLKRLGLTHKVAQVFEETQIYPAPGQGIIVAQTREGDTEIGELLQPLKCVESSLQLQCEQAFLRELEGGCQLPCGIQTEITDRDMKAKGILLSPFESQWVEAELIGSIDHPIELGRELAGKILNAGGREILKAIQLAARNKV